VSQEPLSLKNQWVLVTGGGKRIGATIVRCLHGAGANVAIHYHSSGAEAQQLSAELNRQRDNSSIALQADLNQLGAIEAMIAELVATCGRLDALVNNASSFYPTPLGSITEAQWDDLIGTNLKAPLFLCQAALPHLRANRGSIVNLVDIHAQRPLRDHTVYGPAKAGLAMLTRSLARDLGPDIRVNGVAPGAILWPDDDLSDKTKASIVKQVPLKRSGEPADIARTVLFLLRDAPYITGEIIAVDGGRSVGW
jgi:pteridine reductase